MSQVAIHDLVAGMRLARDVCDRSGRALLRAGAALGDAQIRALKAWGVIEVEIEGVATPVTERATVPDPDRLERVRAALAPRFRHAALDQPFMQALFEQLVERALRTEDEHAP